ncbi:MAG: terminase small subunit [Gammaproteobacteria bacterium]|nr:terminase small subunit [Gammaproteobacteria bacterium]
MQNKWEAGETNFRKDKKKYPGLTINKFYARYSTHKMNSISHRHKMFAMEFHSCHNATKAATQAGYSKTSASTCGARLLKRADVQDELRRLAQEDMGERLSSIDEAKALCWKRIRAGGKDAAVWMGHLIKMEGWGMETSRIELQSLPPPTFILPQVNDSKRLSDGGEISLSLNPTSEYVEELGEIRDIEEEESLQVVEQQELIL